MDLLGVEIFATGFRHGAHVLVDQLDDAARAFKLTGPVPIKVQHQPVTGFEFGYVDNVRRAGEFLIADLIDVPDHLPEQYRFISPETLIPFRVNGREFRRGLTAISLTDRPGTWGLADVFGKRVPEMVMLPTEEHGYGDCFTVENEEAMFLSETLIPNEPGCEYELEVEASGHGALSVGIVGHDENGKAHEALYRAAGGALIGDKRGFSGRISGGDFAMVAPAFESRTSRRMDIDYVNIRKIEPLAAQIDYIKVRKLTPFRTVTFDPDITAQSNWLWARSFPSIGRGADFSAVQSIVNVNIDGEYSVLPLNSPLTNPDSSFNFMIAERFRPDFHPRMPSSGAYMAHIRVRVTSNGTAGGVPGANNGIIQFRPALVAYTRAGSAAGFFDVDSVAAPVRPGSHGADALGGNQWHEAAGTITVVASGAANSPDPNSGPYFVAPCMHIISGAVPAALHSSWIAYLNITAGNP